MFIHQYKAYIKYKYTSYEFNSIVVKHNLFKAIAIICGPWINIAKYIYGVFKINFIE